MLTPSITALLREAMDGLRVKLRGDTRYTSIDQSTSPTFTSPIWNEKPKTRFIPNAPARCVMMGLLGTFALLFVFLLATTRLPTSPPPLSNTPLNVSGPVERPLYLHILIPATETSDDLCRTIYSAAVLDYTSPYLINWGKVVETATAISSIAALNGTLKALERLKQQNDDDIVVLVNDPSLWFQLRPQVLLERYYEINEREKHRIQEQLQMGMDMEGVNQTVLFSSQTDCSLADDSVACWAVPEFAKEQSRHLNHGLVVGPVKSLKAIYQRALQIAVAAGENYPGDDIIFATIYGEQEFQRQCIALRHRTPRQLKWASIVDQFGLRKIGIGRMPIDAHLDACAEGTSFDFGISVDHESRLSQVLTSSKPETGSLNNHKPQHVDPHHAEDLARSPSPFHTLRGTHFPSGDIPASSLKWEQMPLFTSLSTGITGATIRLSSSSSSFNTTSISQEVWAHTWFHPYLRSLLDAHLLEPARPIIAFTPDGRRKEFWGLFMDSGYTERRGVLVDSWYREARWRSFEELCGDRWETLFGDERGKWVDPRF